MCHTHHGGVLGPDPRTNPNLHICLVESGPRVTPEGGTVNCEVARPTSTLPPNSKIPEAGFGDRVLIVS